MSDHGAGCGQARTACGGGCGRRHTALAMVRCSPSAEGTLAEYLIQQGADDTIENNVGCTCYDGIGG